MVVLTSRNPEQMYNSQRWAANEKERHIRLLLDRSYVDEQLVLASNGLSTEIFCAPSDRHPDRRGLLKEKIKNGLDYSTTLNDIPALNALNYITPTEKDTNLILGLYLYFADECSRLRISKTFLTAMREAGALLNPESEFTRPDLLKKMLQALEILGLKDAKYKAILGEWFKQGTYTLGGELHDDPKEGLKGCYAQLARETSSDLPFPAMNRAISYAQGNCRTLRGMSEEEMLHHTRIMIKPENRAALVRCIKHGSEERQLRLRWAVDRALPKTPFAPRSTQTMRHIFSLMPNGSLEILDREGYMFAYSHEKNLQHCYPKDDLPGISAYTNKSSREICNGLRQSRYRTVFLCNGIRGDKEPSGEEVYKAVSQTLLHETMHMAIAYLSNEELLPLKAAVIKVSEEIAASPHCPEQSYPIETNTLAELADCEFKLSYQNYIKFDKDNKIIFDSRWEEVACNLYAINHGDYCVDGIPPFEARAGSLQSLPQLIHEIEKAFNLGLERCRAAYPDRPAVSPGIT